MGRCGLSDGAEIIPRACVLLLAALLAAAPARAADAPERQVQPTLLVHVTSLLDGSTERTVLVPQVVAGALKQGLKVTLLFDAQGVLSLKVGRWFGGDSTPLDRAKIAPRDRARLALLLGTTPESIPDIYGSLLHFFKGRGVAVYVSSEALRLRGISTDGYDRAADAVDAERLVDLLTGADLYITY